MDMRNLLVFFLAIAMVNAATSRDRVARIGNQLRPSASGVDVAGAIFLLNDPIAAGGVIFAFSAFYRSNKPSSYQLYRPTGDKNQFRLIGDLRHIPSVVYSREDVYFESKLTTKCLQVQAGDRLGIFMEEGPGSVSFTFDVSGNPKVLGHTPKGNESTIHPVGSEISFDTLTFPYSFNVAAYMDTDMSHYKGITADDVEVECPKGLLIPDYADVLLPTPTAPAGEPGATGAIGPAGPQGIQGLVGVGVPGSQGERGEVGGNGATGPQGEAGPVGATGEQGSEGKLGNMGATGERGAKGEQGPEGPAGPVILPENIEEMIQASTDKEDESVLSSPLFMFSLIGWLIIITIVVIILIAVIVTVTRRNKRSQASYQEDSEAGYSKSDEDRIDNISPFPRERPNSLHVTKHAKREEVNPDWMSTLKTEKESQMMNETIEEVYNTSQDGQSDSYANSRVELVSDNGSMDSSEFQRPEMVY